MGRLALLALAALIAGPAAAQTATYDPALLDACMAQHEDAGAEACIGRASQACMETEGGQTTAGMIQCLSAEAEQWDGMLNASYGTLTEKDGRAPQLRAAQLAWIEFVDRACAYEAAAYEGGSMAGIAAADCRMRETARRTLSLRTYLKGSE